MSDKDPCSRLRKAVKENNLFLVKRLIKRTDMRNPDPTYRRYTSLAWAAVLGHEETFEWLLSAGHDDQEVSRDSLGNTVLILLAEAKPPLADPYSAGPSEHDFYSATLRMARLYCDRYPDVLDWANDEGRTPAHAAATRGNEELLRMLCDLGADFDLADNDGNTPLHFASAWGHVTILQLLIERGCQFAVRNNDGFTPSDYAYSMNTRDVLQDTARIQFELNKKARRNVFAQAAARGSEWAADEDQLTAPPRVLNGSVRMRSGSGTSRTTSTSDSGGDWSEGHAPASRFTAAASFTSSPSRTHMPLPQSSSSTSPTGLPVPSPQGQASLAPSPAPQALGLSPIASRMRERDAEAMEKYKMRQRSGSAATTSTDAPSLTGSAVSSGNISLPADDMALGSTAPRRRLRPSASAAQLRNNGSQSNSSSDTPHSAQDSRNRSGTSPGVLKRHPSTSTTHTTITTITASPPAESRNVLQTPTQSTTTSSRPSLFGRSMNGHAAKDYGGPPSDFSKFPPPPTAAEIAERERERSHTPTLLHSRRLPFGLLSHKHGADHHFGHKRNTSANSLVSRT